MDRDIQGRSAIGNDNRRQKAPRLVADLVMGLRFFSILPIPGFLHEKPSLRRMAPGLGIVSLLLGLPAGLTMVACMVAGLPNLMSAAIGLGVHMLVSGAMAEDALADSADGFGGRDRERIIDIMRDPRHGTYGCLALLVPLLIRVLALAAIMAQKGMGVFFIFLGVAVLSRQASFILPRFSAPASADGAGKDAGMLLPVAFTVGAAFATLLSLFLVSPYVGWLGYFAMWGAGVAIVAGWLKLSHRRLGGYTGDTIGAAQMLAELAMLIAITAFL